MKTKQAQVSGKELYFYLLLLTGFFLLLEISFFIQCNRTYLADFSFVSDNIHLPAAILPGILFFVMAQLFIHAAYAGVIWLVTVLVSRVSQRVADNKLSFAMGCWTWGVATMLIANQYYLPNSKFSELTYMVFSQSAAKFTYYFLASGCLVILMATLTGLFNLARQKPAYYGVMLVAMTGVYFFNAPRATGVVQDAGIVSRPNIILIGFDSLRPDFLSYFGADTLTPTFDHFLNTATVFSDAVTPLARTFPSWTSILTGEYPRYHGMRSNLADQQALNLSQSLPAILHNLGYETVYATDETRFSNIDKNFGFDRVITPPMGLNDFLIGTFNDFPLSNLLINTALGHWLFPNSYANRPVYFAYSPQSFLNLVSPTLQASRTKPLFLAIHFCLPHYPYLWADLPGRDYTILERYQASIEQGDTQLKQFLNLLRQNHVLDHAVVVLLSDHGEALELNGDRITEKDLFRRTKKNTLPHFYPPSEDKEEINQSAGHGTDVLGLPQYHSLLAFKLFNVTPQESRVVPGLVSLLDIKPTLLALLNLPDLSSNGRSLLSFIQSNTTKPLSLRHLFLESDFSPESIRTVYPETSKVIMDGIQIFQINPNTTRLTVKTSMGHMIISSKQYADIYGDWMLALYPQSKTLDMPILVNLSTGEWTNNMQSNFATQSPAAIMLKELQRFYGDELRPT